MGSSQTGVAARKEARDDALQRAVRNVDSRRHCLAAPALCRVSFWAGG